jgi:hypothetical protein
VRGSPTTLTPVAEGRELIRVDRERNLAASVAFHALEVTVADVVEPATHALTEPLNGR